MMSLNLRVLVAASAVLASFFGLAGFTLDQVYQQNAEQALTETLQGHIFTLIASAELDGKGHLQLPEVVPDTRFSSLGSGLFAQVVRNSTNSLQWQSLSMAGMAMLRIIRWNAFIAMLYLPKFMAKPMKPSDSISREWSIMKSSKRHF